MRDSIGNTIVEGATMFWTNKGLPPLRVVRVTGDSGVTDKSGKALPPSITFEFTLPIDTRNIPKGQEPCMYEFLRVVNPEQEAALNALLDPPQERKPKVVS